MKNLFLALDIICYVEFDPIEHLICTMANKRETNLQELTKVTHKSAAILITLLKYGISKKILTEIHKDSNVFYTLTPYGEKTLASMSSKIIDGWNDINRAIETKNIDEFIKLVKESQTWIQYLRYAKIISTDDADFILDSYHKIIRSRQKKKPSDPEISRLETDARMERTRVLTEQQWKFDDENYEITRDYNNFVDTNYDNNY